MVCDAAVLSVSDLLLRAHGEIVIALGGDMMALAQEFQ